MALASLQQVLVCSLLLLCLGLLIPKLLGGNKSPAVAPSRHQHQPLAAGSGKGLHTSDLGEKSMQKMRKTFEQEMKSKRTEGNGRGLTFTLMPLYAIGVALFAAYKFIKINSEQESASKKEKNAELIKTQETEIQLVELEQHLAQTEVMLNSLLLQLDPLSNCVNALAMGQREEIMTQLQSIRTLMKESGMDKSNNNPKVVNSTCNAKLEGLIHSFGQHHPEKDLHEDKDCGAGDNGQDWPDADDYREAGADENSHHKCSTGQLHDPDVEVEETVVHDIKSEKQNIGGLRQRNRK